jgi:hypothetical protein
MDLKFVVAEVSRKVLGAQTLTVHNYVKSIMVNAKLDQ